MDNNLIIFLIVIVGSMVGCLLALAIDLIIDIVISKLKDRKDKKEQKQLWKIALEQPLKLVVRKPTLDEREQVINDYDKEQYIIKRETEIAKEMKK